MRAKSTNGASGSGLEAHGPPIHEVIEDLGASVAHPDFIGIGIAEEEPHQRVVPALMDQSELISDVSIGLGNEREDLGVEKPGEFPRGERHSVTIRTTGGYVNSKWDWGFGARGVGGPPVPRPP